MFRTIWSQIPRDKDYPARRFTLDVFSRVLDGALYDHIAQPFHEEKTEAGDYVPIRQRRPSVKYNLCRIVVDDYVSLVFDEGHFPDIASEDEGARDAARRMVAHSGLQTAMLEAATIGAVGSVAVHMRVLRQDAPEPQPGANKRAAASSRADRYGVFFEPRSTEFLEPEFDPANPQRLIRLTERYKVKGEDLDPSYAIPADKAKATFWFQRQWDETAETWFLPQLAEDADRGDAPTVDAGRTVQHDLGFVPWVWIRNLPGRLRLIDAAPGPTSYSPVDGACTFAAAIETMIEIDYQLSQAGRGLKYSMDPLLLLKEPASAVGEEGRIVKSPSSAIVVDEKGDAKMLEIGGAAFSVVLDYVRALREFALEQVHGNRADPQKLATATSGRAMELMNQALVWLASRIRVSYGESGLLPLLRMAIAANEKFPLTVGDQPLGQIDPNAEVTLAWPDWYEPTTQDRQAEAGTLSTLTHSSLMSQETAIKQIAPGYDIEDVTKEIAAVQADEERKAALAASKEQITTSV